VLLYHLVYPAKYRRKAVAEAVEHTLTNVCIGIGERYEMHLVEIGTDEDHVHFLVQSVPKLSPSSIAQITKSVTAKEIFVRHPEVRKILWGGEFWTSGFCANTVGRYGNEKAIREYVRKQGRTYHQIHRGQFMLFDL
jgi:REP element-mobilizing transposase RayT